MTHNAADADISSLIERGLLAEARALAQQRLARAEGQQRGPLLLALSAACAISGMPVDALRAALGAGEVFRTAGDRVGQCDALHRVGVALRSVGDHSGAIEAFEEAESLARDLGDEFRRAAVLQQIGVCCSLVGRHQHALSCLTEAYEIHRESGVRKLEQGTRLSLYNALNRQATALPADAPERQAGLLDVLPKWAELADECRTDGNARLAVMAQGNHAITLLDCGRAAEAIEELESLLPQYRAMGLKPNEAICWSELGRCHAAIGAHGPAREHFMRAVEMLEAEGSLDELRDALDGLASAEEALGDYRAALAAMHRLRATEQQRTDEAARSAAARRELRIELARLTSQWAVQAQEDPLTGLGNRRALERWMAEHWPRAERGEPLSLLLLDLDHFKRVNDSHGHGVGDAVLRGVAEVLAANCRGRDLAVRYGGEEFLLALASVDDASAVAVAQRLRDAIEARPWSGIAPGLAVSVSIGAAHAREVANGEALLTLADRRLYAAKFGGRNRVVHSG